MVQGSTARNVLHILGVVFDFSDFSFLCSQKVLWNYRSIFNLSLEMFSICTGQLEMMVFVFFFLHGQEVKDTTEL